MVARNKRSRKGDGIDCAVSETGFGRTGAILEPMSQKREGAGLMSGALHLAEARSNRGPQGQKKDFRDAEPLVKRLVAQELTLSFVPDAEQRLWRTVMRRRYQLTRNRRLQPFHWMNCEGKHWRSPVEEWNHARIGKNLCLSLRLVCQN